MRRKVGLLVQQGIPYSSIRKGVTYLVIKTALDRYTKKQSLNSSEWMYVRLAFVLYQAPAQCFTSYSIGIGRSGVQLVLKKKKSKLSVSCKLRRRVLRQLLKVAAKRLKAQAPSLEVLAKRLEKQQQALVREAVEIKALLEHHLRYKLYQATVMRKKIVAGE